MSSIGKYVFIVLFVFAGLGWIARPATAQQKTAAVLSGSFESQRPVISVNFNNEPLPEVLHVLARKVQAGISYKTDMVPSKLITYQAENKNIFDVLAAVLKGTGLYATLTDNRKVIMIKKRQLQKVVQVQSTVSGTVTDAGTGKTLPGVNIVVQGTQNGTYTNSKGHYELSVESLQDTLVFSFVGYQSKTVPIKGRTSVDVEMKASAAQLENVVVTALGIKQKERSLGYSTQQVSGESIQKSNQNGVISSLQGKTAGVDISGASGAPGAPSRITIRGNSSITGDNQPLFVIDGMPISNSGGGGDLFSGVGTSRAIDIDPNIIKSVNVLKGASATALYGQRAANGAIIITTKGGSFNQQAFEVEVNSIVGIGTPIIDGYQHTYLQGSQGKYANGEPLSRGGYIEPGYPGNDPQTFNSWGPAKDEVSQQVLNDLGVCRTKQL